MGCKEAFPLAKKAAHERDCPFLQLKCPFHGQCVFNGSLADVVPHLAAEHSVTPVPVQPAGTLFYRAKVLLPPILKLCVGDGVCLFHVRINFTNSTISDELVNDE
jgi:hypothetical protein